MGLELLQGPAARSALDDAEFMRAWRGLYTACSWATAYQREDFSRVWYSVYAGRYQPLILVWKQGGELQALWAMAEGPDGLVTAGAHQCEYQSWLSQAECQTEFLRQALSVLKPLSRQGVLELRYLPARHPLAGLDLREYGRAIGYALRKLPFPRPLVDLSAESVGQRSLAKKKNRRRLRLLAELGALRFERITDADTLEAMLPAIASSYDDRQQELSGNRPFADDALKAEFHLRLLRETTLLHVTTFSAGDLLLGAQMGPSDRGEMHMGVYAYATEHAEHSPGRMTLHHLAARLEEEGTQTLDLTPGGRWKETYATHQDEVLVLLVFFGRFAALKFDLVRWLRSRLRPLREYWRERRGVVSA